jgi:hypothetical protein
MTSNNGNKIALESGRMESSNTSPRQTGIGRRISGPNLDQFLPNRRTCNPQPGILEMRDADASSKGVSESDFAPEALGGWPELPDQSLQITQSRAREQEACNEHTEFLLRQQVKEDERLREFAQEIHWLKHSDAMGRCEYLLNNNRKSIIARLSSFLVLQTTMRRSAAFTQRTTELRAAVLALNGATRDLERTRSAADRERHTIQAELDRRHSKRMLQHFARLLFWDLFLAAWAAAAIFMAVELAREIIGIGLANLEGILLWSAGLTLCAGEAALNLEMRKSVSKQRREIVPPQIPYLAPDSRLRIHRDLESERAARLESARQAYRTLQGDWQAVIAETLGLSLANGSFLNEFKACIGDSQKRFPRLLHVDWDAIQPELLEQLVTSLSDSIIEPARNKGFTPAFLLEAFKNSEDSLWQLDLEANQQLLQEVFRTDHLSSSAHLHTVEESAGNFGLVPAT